MNQANYYLAQPESGNGKPVLVLHAWWGLNDFIKELCNRLAQEGFVALAPDLYHGAVASTIEQAKQFSSALEFKPAAQEINQAVAQLQSVSGTNTRGIGVVGFSLGGAFALWLAAQESSPVVATVVFYASYGLDFSLSRSAFQFHLAETDIYEPAEEIEKTQNSLRAANKPAECYTYPSTTHWFFESDRTDAYNAKAANLAWNRTIDFLKAHVV